MSLAFNNAPEVKVDPRYILYFAYAKKQHEHFKGNFDVYMFHSLV